MTLSVCLIVRNEEEVLARCLDCVKKFADEIVVVDTGSTDKTEKIAASYTDKLYHYEWCDDFAAARNFAFSKATCDYVMWLDADDVIDAKNCTRIRNLVDLGGFDMAYLLYAAAFEVDSPTFVYNRERIFLRSLDYRFSGAVHEVVVPRGKAVYSEARIDHKKIKSGDPMRNLKIYQKRISEGISLDEREKFYYGRELLFNKMYRESVAVLENFLSGDGWVENKIEACINLYYCYTELGDNDKALQSLLKTFLYDSPRAQVCCMLGDYFMEKLNTYAAIYWYTRALDCKNDCKNELQSGAFVNTDYSEFVPCMQLCVIYDRLGEYKKANEFNERAGKIKPCNAQYLHNRQYLFCKLAGVITDT